MRLVFGLKVFGAAMLALWLALRLGLEHPAWAMLTAFIVAQPVTGMAIAKGLYRLLGTLAGAAFAMAALVALAGAPELQALAFSVWLGGCVFLGALDRTARAYAFLLAGYSACLIGLPLVQAPEAIFATVLARVEEIGLGVACMTLVDALILPQPARPLLLRRVAGWRADIGRWARDVLAGTAERARARADLRQLMASFAALEELRAAAAYDAETGPSEQAALHRMQRQAQTVLSQLVAIGQRLATFRDRDPDPSAPLAPLLARIGAWMAEGAPAGADALRAALAEVAPDDKAIRHDDDTLLLRTLVERLDELVLVWARFTALGDDLPAEDAEAGGTAQAARHRDPLLAGLAGLSAFLALLVSCALWIALAWPQGATVAMMAGTICALFGVRDDPVQPAQRFLLMSLLGSALALVYLFGILPQVDGFLGLTLVLLPVFLPLAMCLQQPALAASAVPVIIGSLGAMGLDHRFSADIAAFVNGALALNLGIVLAILALRLGRAVGVEWEVERVMRAVRLDLARLGQGDPGLDRVAFEGRMHDRIALLVRRLAGAEPPLAARLGDALGALRVGLNLDRLHRLAPALPEPARTAVNGLRAEAGRAARERRPHDHLLRLLAAADRAVAEVTAVPASEPATAALLALAGLRHAVAGHGFLPRPPATALAAA